MNEREEPLYEHWCNPDYKTEFLHHPLEKDVLRLVNKYQPSGSILDLGCGNGNILALLKNRETLGLEPSKIGYRQCLLKGLNVENKWLEYFKSDKKFKVILMLGFLCQFKEPGDVLKKVKNLLDKNGIVIVTLRNKRSVRRWFGLKKSIHEKDGDYTFYAPSYKEFKKLCNWLGLEIIHAEGGGHLRNHPSLSLTITYVLRRKNE